MGAGGGGVVQHPPQEGSWGSFALRAGGVGAAAPIQMRLPGGVYVNTPGGEGDESPAAICSVVVIQTECGCY